MNQNSKLFADLVIYSDIINELYTEQFHVPSVIKVKVVKATEWYFAKKVWQSSFGLAEKKMPVSRVSPVKLRLPKTCSHKRFCVQKYDRQEF